MHIRKNIKYCTSLIAISTVGAVTINTVYAQETENNSKEEEEKQEERRGGASALTQEIVVTATKKNDGEALQKTNLAISAFGADQLQALQVRDISDLSFQVPNVQLDEIGTTKGTANFSIRGLGVNSSIPSIDPAVGVFIDGIYLGVNTGVVFDTFDLAGVETLRGPQGVLFGRNVTGGAVLINTGNPTDELTFNFKAAVESGLRGTGENYIISGVVSGPLTNGLNGKIGAYYNDDRGFHENLFDGSNFGLSETLLLRGALELDAVPGLNILAKVEYGNSDGDGPAAQSHQNGSGVDSFATNIPTLLPPGIDPASQTFDRNTFDFAVNTRGFQDTEWINISFRTDIDVGFGNGTITNIFGYRSYEQTSLSDIDASIVQIFDAAFNVDQEQFSNELRYNGRFFGDRLDFTAGVFYFQQDIVYEEQRRVGTAQTAFDGGGILDHETFGVFAAGEFELTPRLTLNAGIRYTDESKDADIAQIELFAGSGSGDPLAGTPCFIFSGGSNDRVCTLDPFETFSTSNFSPKVGFGYELTENARFYGHWSRAFRAGGFNLRNTEDPNAAIFFGAGPFEDERIDSFELGFKTEPVPGARLNISAFYNVLDDLQREVNVPGGTAVVQQIITNAADAEIYGLEADLVWPITRNFIINGSLGITEGSFTDVTVNLTAASAAELAEAPGSDDLELQIPRLSPFTASFGATYTLDVGSSSLLTFNVNYSHRDQAFFTDNNLGFINAQDRIDFSISYDIADTGANLTVYGNNLTNEVLHGGDTQLSNGTFSPLSKGRILGIEFNYKY